MNKVRLVALAVLISISYFFLPAALANIFSLTAKTVYLINCTDNTIGVAVYDQKDDMTSFSIPFATLSISPGVGNMQKASCLKDTFESNPSSCNLKLTAGGHVFDYKGAEVGQVYIVYGEPEQGHLCLRQGDACVDTLCE